MSDLNYCEFLGEETEEETFTANYKGKKIQVSDSVIDSDFFECDCCCEYHHTDVEESTVNSEKICRDCRDEHYFWCDYENDWCPIDEMETTEHGDCVYDSYAHNNMYQCPECSRYSEYDFDEGHCCDHCGYEQNSEDSCGGLVLPYDENPSLNFYGHETKLNPYIGFEIEIEARDSRQTLAETCDSYFPECFLKNDGSLDDGFEVVSHPKTLDFHLEQKKKYQRAMREAIAAGGRSHDTSTCGLHFHLDKKYMSEGHKVRFGMFFAMTQDSMALLARRTSDRWCQFKERGLPWDEYKESERYEAVNWTNRDTVEVRIFKGTLKFSTFMASMELCHAVYSFTYNKQAFSTNFTSEAIFRRFLGFVKKENSKKDRYTFLVDYLKSKSFNLEVNQKINA